MQGPGCPHIEGSQGACASPQDQAAPGASLHTPIPIPGRSRCPGLCCCLRPSEPCSSPRGCVHFPDGETKAEHLPAKRDWMQLLRVPLLPAPFGASPPGVTPGHRYLPSGDPAAWSPPRAGAPSLPWAPHCPLLGRQPTPHRTGPAHPPLRTSLSRRLRLPGRCPPGQEESPLASPSLAKGGPGLGA